MVLGFDLDEPYLNGTSPSFSAVVGRYANRIANHTFTLNGQQYILNSNDGNNTLHGGLFNFGRLLWYPNPNVPITKNSVSLQHLSPDGDNVCIEQESINPAGCFTFLITGLSGRVALDRHLHAGRQQHPHRAL